MPDLSPVRVTIGETAGSYPANVVPPTGLPANTPNRFNARVVATGNISLSGTPVIDGYQTVVGDRVLAIGQTTTSNNGVYVVAATGSWQRAIDLSLASQFSGPIRVSVEVGTAGRSKTYQFLPTSTVVIGTTALVFTDADTWTKAEADARYPLIANTLLTYSTRTAAITANLSAIPLGGLISTSGYTTSNDRGGGVYVKVASAPAHSGFFTSADSSIFELRETRPTIEMFGGGTGVADNVAAYNAAIGYCAVIGASTLRMEAQGTYSFGSKPNIIQSPLVIIGAGKSLTYLRRSYSGASNDEGFIEFRHPSSGGQIQNSGVKGIHLFPNTGTTNGTMLKVSTQGPVSGYFTSEDFCVSQAGLTGTYWRAWLIDGSANTTLGSQGFRDCASRDTFLFSTSENAETFRVLNGVNCSFDLWTSGNVTIFGGAGATAMSTRINIYGIILGQLFISNATRVTSWAQVDSLIHSTNSDNCEHWGNVSGGGYTNSGAASNLCGGRIGFDATRGATSGYQRLPGGGLIQRMRVTLTTSFASYTFPIAFSSGCTPIVVGTSRSSAFTVFGGSHSLSAASLAASTAGDADIIAFGW